MEDKAYEIITSPPIMLLLATIIIVGIIGFLNYCATPSNAADPLPHAKPYKILDRSEVDAGRRSREVLTIEATEAATPDDYAQTAIRAAVEIQKQYLYNAVMVLINGPCNTYGVPCARVTYIADGRGWSGTKTGEFWESGVWIQKAGKHIHYPVPEAIAKGGL